MYVFLFFLATVFLLANGHVYNEEGWAKAGKYMQQAMNLSANPCEDFYEYACGRWEQKYRPKYKHFLAQARSDAMTDLIKAIKSIKINDRKTKPYQKRLKTFWTQCVEATEDADVILKEIYAQIEKDLGPMPLISGQSANATYNPYKMMGKMQRLFNTSVLVSAFLTRRMNPEGCSFKALLALQPANVKDNHRFEFNSTMTQRFLKFALEKGVNRETFMAQVQLMADLENETLSLADTGSRLPTNYDVKKLDFELAVNGSSWSWQDYFQALLPMEGYAIWKRPSVDRKNRTLPTEVQVTRTAYFAQLQAVFERYSADTVVNYAYWRAARNYLAYFLEAPQYSNVTEKNIDRQCLSYVLEYASAAAAKVYFESLGSSVQDWKYDVELTAQAVFSAFRYIIYNADWLDLQDKVTIMNKLKMIQFDSGIPDWILNETSVEDHTPPFDPARSTFENDLHMFRQKFAWKFLPLWANQTAINTPGDPRSGSMLDAEPNFHPNADYNEQRIALTLGAILPPLYNYSYPLALKFASVGAMVAEQVMHAFDPTEQDESLAIGKLLRPASVEQFVIRRECHGIYAAAAAQHLYARCFNDSERNKNYCEELVERTANDAEGMKLAYMAYAFMIQTVGREPDLPELVAEDYDADQLFFLSFARQLCGKRDMVEVPLITFPAFSNAFNCTPGQRYYTLEHQECVVWSNVSDISVGGRSEH